MWTADSDQLHVSDFHTYWGLYLGEEWLWIRSTAKEYKQSKSMQAKFIETGEEWLCIRSTGQDGRQSQFGGGRRLGGWPTNKSSKSPYCHLTHCPHFSIYVQFWKGDHVNQIKPKRLHSLLGPNSAVTFKRYDKTGTKFISRFYYPPHRHG